MIRRRQQRQAVQGLEVVVEVEVACLVAWRAGYRPPPPYQIRRAIIVVVTPPALHVWKNPEFKRFKQLKFLRRKRRCINLDKRQFNKGR